MADSKVLTEKRREKLFDEIRAKALFDQVRLAGAQTVAAAHIQEELPLHLQSGWCEIWHNEVAHA